MDRLCGSEIRKFRKVFVLKERTGVILTEIRLLLLLLLTGASAERRRMRRSVRRVRQSGQSRMRPGVALLDRSGVVVGERHRIRFRARCRLPGKNKMCGLVPPSTSADVCGLNFISDTQCGSADW